ncbi:MAG TPA: hypothetical protein VEJ86_06810, partial [Candidatus Binataceae bacterium]|nr:hypothetical protein [Candidatus Binataceae bacterium]
MNRVTIVTKLRFAAVIAPIVLLIAMAVVALTVFQFGALPAQMYDDQYAAMRAADGMEIALNKMDWGRYQPDGSQIVLDQQRQFGEFIENARGHVDTPEQADKLQSVGDHAQPLFDSMRKAAAGDTTLEPKVLDLQSR